MSSRAVAILVGWLMMVVIGGCCLKGVVRMAGNLSSVPTADQQLAALR
jgi:hypothetical protein